MPVGWRYSGFHSFFETTVGLQKFVRRAGVDIVADTLLDESPAICCNPPSGGFDYSSTTTFSDLQSGDIYGFRLSGSHNDGAKTLTGTLVLHEIDDTAPVITPQVSGNRGGGRLLHGTRDAHVERRRRRLADHL